MSHSTDSSEIEALPNSSDSQRVLTAYHRIAELTRSEERLKVLLENMPDGYFLHDMNGIFVDGNRAAELITGYAREELIGHSFFDVELLSPDQLEKAAEGLGRSFRGEPTGPDEYILTRKDGGTIAVEIRTFPLELEGQLYVLGLARDITGRKRQEAELERYREHLEDLVALRTRELELSNESLREEMAEHQQAQEALRSTEERLQRSQRLESVGRLAGGIAHDFNNVLSGIVGFSDLLLMSLPDDVPYRGHVEEILRSAQRASSLTRQLLAFSRRQVLSPQTVSLNDIVRELGKMLGRLLHEGLELSLDLSEDLWPVRVDQGQLEQVIINLALNARDAIGDQGRVSIRTGNVVLEHPLPSTDEDIAPGDWVVLEVKDDGTGMDESVLSQIFEPFFTTKSETRGTGLGLSMVYGIVKQSGGHIVVESEPGVGTAFRLHLPRVTREVRDPTPAPLPAEAPPGTGTVLVVEDDETVRRLVRLVLVAKGYDVIEAANGRAALEVFEQHDGAVDLLVTDIAMPKMTGPDLAAALRTHAPSLKVVFMSGHAEEQVELDQDAGPLVRKPFSPRELAALVHRLLTHGPG